jgi:short-subunit dehydrogenase
MSGILLVNSAHSQSPVPCFTNYSASKIFSVFQMQGLTQEVDKKKIDILC